MLGMLKINNDFLDSIREAQKLDVKLVNSMVGIDQSENNDFRLDAQGMLRFHNRICIPDDPEIKRMILEESHRSNLSIYPGATKMYQDLKNLSRWPGMKRDVVQFVYACLTCQKSKVIHQKRVGLMKPLEVPEWKWDSISMDFEIGLPNTSRGHDTIWVIVDRLTKSAHFIPINISFRVSKLAEIYTSAIFKLHDVPLSLYGRRCRTTLCWHESGESVVLGPEIVRETTEKVKLIREKMKTSQSRQKSYYDKRRKYLEFQAGDHMFLRVTPVIVVGRALEFKKLTPRFIAPSHVIHMDDLQVRDNLTVETMPVRIADHEMKTLRGKDVALVKVVWSGAAGESMTWEYESGVALYRIAFIYGQSCRLMANVGLLLCCYGNFVVAILTFIMCRIHSISSWEPILGKLD
ncbi:uncharacterized protein LOC131613397 [Vicia villosa]|uniref:uncharacterized protein LOC131613397 n=1 Tax=Vicia villosa TaxID=3911 RepID=UPI00273BB570|nr:uncharacterized protein LOC131613397 [Vicia villosa]